MLMQEKITAIIPTLNEEKNIEGAINSLSFADEIIIIDSFSADQTLAICEKFNVKLIQRRFDDFSSQKNYAIEQASHDWIFILDADERISQTLSDEIKELMIGPQSHVAFNIYRTFFYEGQKVKYGGWQTDKVIRLFRKDKCRYDGKLVHEEIICEGLIGSLVNKMDHYSFRNHNQYKSKLEFYAELQAQELLKSRKKVYPLRNLLKPGFRFMVLYIIRFGFLDGAKGFNLARMHAYAVEQRYVKYKSLLKTQ